MMLVDGRNVWETLNFLAFIPDPWWKVDWKPVYFLTPMAFYFKQDPTVPVGPESPSLSLLPVVVCESFVQPKLIATSF